MIDDLIEECANEDPAQTRKAVGAVLLRFMSELRHAYDHYSALPVPGLIEPQHLGFGVEQEEPEAGEEPHEEDRFSEELFQDAENNNHAFEPRQPNPANPKEVCEAGHALGVFPWIGRALHSVSMLVAGNMVEWKAIIPASHVSTAHHASGLLAPEPDLDLGLHQSPCLEGSPLQPRHSPAQVPAAPKSRDCTSQCCAPTAVPLSRTAFCLHAGTLILIDIVFGAIQGRAHCKGL